MDYGLPNQKQNPISKITNAKGAGGIAQAQIPELKP
jgi:hypothetical protein